MNIATDYAVLKRREEVAKKYFECATPNQIWSWYSTTYQLSRESMENDITIIRREAKQNVKENFEEILNNVLSMAYSTMERVSSDTGLTASAKYDALYKGMGTILNTLKLVAPKQTNQVAIQFNHTTNNLNLPGSVNKMDGSRLEELKKLLGRNDAETIEVESE